MNTRFTRFAAVAAAGLSLAVMAGCSGNKTTPTPAGSTAASSDVSATIALLLPETKTTRYETFDKPYFEAALKTECPKCTLIYNNANQDAAKQQQQAESAMTQGAKVLVLDAVDGKSAQTIVNEAKAKGVKVVAYDRFVAGSDYYVSFDNLKVGELQAQTLVDILKKSGKTSGDLVMINGSPTDANAADFKKGAHSVLDTSGFTIKAEYDTPDWSPDKAQAWMEGELTSVRSGLVGVYAANDGVAGGAITALKAGGVNPMVPVTGQDAEITGVQRVVAGDQAMTVYKAIKPEASDAAKNAVALAKGTAPTSSTTKDGVPATLLTPVAVTKDNIKDTVVKDGFYTIDQICTSQFASACSAAGLK
ncbi:D-xylose transport system substrate-binding protein [Raineyella antarctica]|uniref:D-xylose transport system substrate-binding protein n=1 Tax=Raineyella antarctica TaxID=1577474 RepID=A0A1G6GW35_9ACTN|nr:substrate-binding domain-containing protein [Raineyella antarctica]SDB86174.1 D-xylose transport system substrate-binding protein [Raineyella antarctica]